MSESRLGSQGGVLVSPEGGLPDDLEAIEEVELRIKYAGYIARQEREVQQARELEGYVFEAESGARHASGPRACARRSR